MSTGPANELRTQRAEDIDTRPSNTPSRGRSRARDSLMHTPEVHSGLASTPLVEDLEEQQLQSKTKHGHKRKAAEFKKAHSARNAERSQRKKANQVLEASQTQAQPTVRTADSITVPSNTVQNKSTPANSNDDIHADRDDGTHGEYAVEDSITYLHNSTTLFASVKTGGSSPIVEHGGDPFASITHDQSVAEDSPSLLASSGPHTESHEVDAQGGLQPDVPYSAGVSSADVAFDNSAKVEGSGDSFAASYPTSNHRIKHQDAELDLTIAKAKSVQAECGTGSFQAGELITASSCGDNGRDADQIKTSAPVTTASSSPTNKASTRRELASFSSPANGSLASTHPGATRRKDNHSATNTAEDVGDEDGAHAAAKITADGVSNAAQHDNVKRSAASSRKVPTFDFSDHDDAIPFTFTARMPGSFPSDLSAKRSKLTHAESDVDANFGNNAEAEHMGHQAEDSFLLGLKQKVAAAGTTAFEPIAAVRQDPQGISREFRNKCVEFVAGYFVEPVAEDSAKPETPAERSIADAIFNAPRFVKRKLDRMETAANEKPTAPSTFHVSQSSSPPKPLFQVADSDRTTAHRVSQSGTDDPLDVPYPILRLRDAFPGAQQPASLIKPSSEQAASKSTESPKDDEPADSLSNEVQAVQVVEPPTIRRCFSDEQCLPGHLMRLVNSRLTHDEKIVVYLFDMHGVGLEFMLSRAAVHSAGEAHHILVNWLHTEGGRYECFIHEALATEMSEEEAHEIYVVATKGPLPLKLDLTESTHNRAHQFANDTKLRAWWPEMWQWIRQELPPPQPLSTDIEGIKWTTPPEPVDVKMSGMVLKPASHSGGNTTNNSSSNRNAGSSSNQAPAGGFQPSASIQAPATSGSQQPGAARGSSMASMPNLSNPATNPAKRPGTSLAPFAGATSGVQQPLPGLQPPSQGGFGQPSTSQGHGKAPVVNSLNPSIQPNANSHPNFNHNAGATSNAGGSGQSSKAPIPPACLRHIFNATGTRGAGRSTQQNASARPNVNPAGSSWTGGSAAGSTNPPFLPGLNPNVPSTGNGGAGGSSKKHPTSQ